MREGAGAMREDARGCGSHAGGGGKVWEEAIGTGLMREGAGGYGSHAEGGGGVREAAGRCGSHAGRGGRVQEEAEVMVHNKRIKPYLCIF